MERIQIVMVLATPLSDRTDEFGGAVINVYTTESSVEAAEELAFREAEAVGWRPHVIEEQFWLTRDDLHESPEGSGVLRTGAHRWTGTRDLHISSGD